VSGVEEAKACVALLDRVVFHPHNVRRNLGDLRQLTSSIELHGILQPVTLERYGDMLRVRMGHRRVAAARLAGLRKVPALVHAEALDDTEFLYLALHENTVRRGLNLQEIRGTARALHESGESYADIAANLGVSYGTVAKWVSADRRDWAARKAGGAVAPGRRVPLTQLREVLTAWERDLRGGLTPDQGRDLLGELEPLAYPDGRRAAPSNVHHLPANRKATSA
jgi:ParB/RepB/Spo0J family partition protein